VTGIDRVVLFAAISWLGLWVHELHRVPALFGFTPDGDLFMLPVVAVLTIWWLFTHSTAALVGLGVYAAVNLVGGLVSVFPFGWLPFKPAQTASHYGVHVIFAVCQLPLLAITTTRIIRRPRLLSD
jgi:hypothetical protein